MQRPRDLLLRVFLFLACADAGVAQFGLVLCVEPSGDVNVETSLIGDSCGGAPASECGTLKELNDPKASAEGCPCVDAPLSFDADRSRPCHQVFDLKTASTPVMVVPTAGRMHVATSARIDAYRQKTHLEIAATLVGNVILRV